MSNTNKQPDEPLLVGEAETEKRLHLSQRTLYSMRIRGEIPYVRIGRRILYSLEARRSWIRANEETGKAGTRNSHPYPPKGQPNVQEDGPRSY